MFSQLRVFNFLNFIKKRQNLTNATLQVWPWHSMLKIRKITEKESLQFCKLTFLGLSDQAISKFAQIQVKIPKFR